MIQKIKYWPSRLLRFLVMVYQGGISPYLGIHCRYTPTCSAYARQALLKHGALKGGWLALCRIGRCHPFCRHAHHDPVPDELPRFFSGRRASAGLQAAPSSSINADHSDNTKSAKD